MEKTKNNQENIDDGDDLSFGTPEQQKEKVKEKFFDACKNGNVEIVQKLINHELLDILELDSGGWSALQWAIVNNHPEIVKIVYKKYEKEKNNKKNTKSNTQIDESKKISLLQNFDSAFEKPLNPADSGKYTPLHWSAYKGLNLISSILLKMGCDPMEVDNYGDNSLHQAAAGNNYDTFKLFMGLGIDLELKNSRSHKVIDLTTNKDIQNLINKILNEKKCEICGKAFDFDNKRYLCYIKEEIICKNCAVIDYYYDTEDAKEKDLMECRCKKCQDDIIKVEKKLNEAIESQNLEKLKSEINESKKYRIDLHLKKLALQNEDKLFREKEINELLESLKVVSDHKIILKKVYELEEKIKSAEEKKVIIDQNLLNKALKEKGRLLAEKDLRQLLSNLSIEMASEENLKDLNEKVEIAKNNNVSDNYIKIGLDLIEKYKSNLDAKDILKKFEEYPTREYPVIEDDPKKSNYLIFNFFYFI